MKRMMMLVVLGGLWMGSALADEVVQGKIEQALQLVGMESHFVELQGTLVRGLNQRRYEGVSSGAVSYAELESLIKKNFAPQLLNSQLAERLVDHYDANRFDMLLSSLQSDQIQGVRLRVEQAAAEDNLEQLRAYASGYKEAPLSQQKSYIIDGLDRASAGNELYAGVQALATLTMLRLQEVQDGIAPQFEEALLLQQLYSEYLESGRYTTEMIYRSALGELTPEQLQLSLRIYRSTVVQWFLGLAVENLTLVAADQREQLLTEVSEALKSPSS